jgi:hypothetical protein
MAVCTASQKNVNIYYMLTISRLARGRATVAFACPEDAKRNLFVQ